jgi:hypothetical protein
MKFMCFFLPTVPGTYEERVRLRPIAHHNDRIQRMIEEFTELSKMAEDLGFDMIGFPEHFLHTEGLEFGSVPAVYAYIAAQTKHVKVGPIGYVLPGGIRCVWRSLSPGWIISPRGERSWGLRAVTKADGSTRWRSNCTWELQSAINPK